MAAIHHLDPRRQLSTTARIRSCLISAAIAGVSSAKWRPDRTLRVRRRIGITALGPGGILITIACRKSA